MNDSLRPGRNNRSGLGRWIIFLIVIGLLLVGAGDAAYRSSLPTDGWATEEAGDVTFLDDLIGMNTGLQPDDQLISIDGIPANPSDFKALRPQWQVGNTLEYEVKRGGQVVVATITLIRWPSGKAFWNTFLTQSALIDLLLTFVMFGLAVFIFLRQPMNPAAESLLLIMAIFLGITLSEIVPISYTIWIDPTASFLQGRVTFFLLVTLFPFAILRFAMTFPRPKPVYLKRSWLPALAGIIGLCLLVFFPESSMSWFLFVLSFVGAVVVLIHNAFTMRDAVSRAQIRWGVGGFVIGFGVLAIMLLLNTTEIISISTETFAVISNLALLIMVTMIAVGISRYRLFDINVIIRKTLVYAILSGLLALVYFGLVVVLQNLFDAVSGQQSPLVIVLSTLIIAALFAPLRQRVQVAIDRRFYRRKYDAQQILALFAQTARDEVEMNVLQAELLRAVQEAMQPDGATVWLKERSK